MLAALLKAAFYLVLGDAYARGVPSGELYVDYQLPLKASSAAPQYRELSIWTPTAVGHVVLIRLLAYALLRLTWRAWTMAS